MRGAVPADPSAYLRTEPLQRIALEAGRDHAAASDFRHRDPPDICAAGRGTPGASRLAGARGAGARRAVFGDGQHGPVGHD
jgi:hypothetical protein